MTVKEFLTPAELGKLAGVSAMTIIRHCNEEKIAHTRTLGGHRRISRVACAAYLRRVGLPTTALDGAR